MKKSLETYRMHLVFGCSEFLMFKQFVPQINLLILWVQASVDDQLKKTFARLSN